MILKIAGCFFTIMLCATAVSAQDTAGAYTEAHRPQIHFSPKEKWMNDPNGMLYYNNTYHLFYQYYPGGTVWGPMHWGHATTKDLLHWQHQPIALYPDSLGYIFSGSAVADIHNTSGFGHHNKTPLVAIFTHHDARGEKAGSDTYQNQSIAYSLDDGKTWKKYEKNPVLKNPGIKDFRDPKVSWFEPTKKWIMTLATLDRITFYSSPNLKDWTKESEFGKEVGAHGGVWECPDLFPLDYHGQKVWILVVNINPGGPNGGSATQYFTGRFNGSTFTPYQTDTRWIDYGPDEYAGVTWSNTGDKKIFLGWMSNWQYATLVPTQKWRSAMTVPRLLALQQAGDTFRVTSQPVKDFGIVDGKEIVLEKIAPTNYNLTEKTGMLAGAARLTLSTDTAASFSITLLNDLNEKVVIGYDKPANHYFIDRAHAGEVNFEKTFAGVYTAPRLSVIADIDLTLIIDDASVELFADNGLSVMTGIFFPHKNFSIIEIQSAGNGSIKKLTFNKLKSIWK